MPVQRRHQTRIIQPVHEIAPPGEVDDLVVVAQPVVGVANRPFIIGDGASTKAHNWRIGSEEDLAKLAKKFRSRAAKPSVVLNDYGGVLSMSWSEQDISAAVTGQIVFHDEDGRIANYTRPGTWLVVLYMLAGRAYEIGRFFVWEQTDGDERTAEVRVTVLDQLARLHKVGPEDMVWRSSTGTSPFLAIEQIARKYGVDIRTPRVNLREGSPDMHMKYLALQQHTPLEQIIKLLSVDTQVTGRKWRIRDVRGVIWITQLHKVDEGFVTLQINADANMISGEITRSLDHKKTWVTVKGARAARAGTDLSSAASTPNVFYEVNAYTEDVLVYGKIHQTIDLSDRFLSPSRLQKVASNRLMLASGLGRSANFEVDGSPIVRAGDAARIIDKRGTKLNGIYFLGGVTHQITGRKHTMTCDIAWVARVPKVLPTTEERTDPTTTPQAVRDRARSLPLVGTLLDNTGTQGTRTTGSGRPYRGQLPQHLSPTNSRPPDLEAYAGDVRSDKEMGKVIDAYIERTKPNSPLRGYGKMMATYGRRANVDGRFCAAVAYAENQLATTNLPGRYNTWGMTKRGGGFLSFNSWEDGIRHFFWFITNEGSPYRGARTIRQIANIWAPIGASNDPNNLNRNWHVNVTRAWAAMGGQNSEDSVVRR